MQISDRTKDVIKSGGEWISSVELENQVMGHPGVFEAAVIGVPDQRWDERPLVVRRARRGRLPDRRGAPAVPVEQGGPVGAARAVGLHRRVPKTSVGKFDKKVLRAQLADGELDVVTVDLPPA